MEKYVKLGDVKELLNRLSLSGFAMIASEGFKLFDDLPTLSTKESNDLLEGTWEERGGSSFLEKKFIFYCSECGDSGSNAWSYCPHCGAKMKNKVKESIKEVRFIDMIEKTEIVKSLKSPGSYDIFVLAKSLEIEDPVRYSGKDSLMETLKRYDLSNEPLKFLPPKEECKNENDI